MEGSQLKQKKCDENGFLRNSIGLPIRILMRPLKSKFVLVLKQMLMRPAEHLEGLLRESASHHFKPRLSVMVALPFNDKA